MMIKLYMHFIFIDVLNWFLWKVSKYNGNTFEIKNSYNIFDIRWIISVNNQKLRNKWSEKNEEKKSNAQNIL